MEWQTSIQRENEGPKYIEVITSGAADQAGSLRMAQAIAQTMRTNRITRVLIDHRQVTGVSGTPPHIAQRPKIFRIIGVLLRVKIAELIRPEHLEHFQYFETVCRNQGYQITVFVEKEPALSWLLE